MIRISILIAATVWAIGTTSSATDPNYPKLFFSYSFLYDGACSPNNPVTEAWAVEARNREAEFSALWEKEAPILFEKLFQIFGKGFVRKELTATLSVCHGGGSFSNPLVLDIAPYLKSYMNPDPVRPNHGFIDLVFHELLHTWLVDNFSFSSPLLEKYKNESRTLRFHLHLMAVQKLIFLELGRTDLLDWISFLYLRIQGDYARAWEIVNTTEGYEAFIAELKHEMPL